MHYICCVLFDRFPQRIFIAEKVNGTELCEKTQRIRHIKMHTAHDFVSKKVRVVGTVGKRQES